MAILRKRITETRKRYLEEVVTNIVNDLLKRDDVECISYICSKEDRYNLPASITGNAFELHVILNHEVDDKIKNEIIEYEKEFYYMYLSKKTGVDLGLSVTDNKNYKLFNVNEIDFKSDKLFYNNPMWNVRYLHFSNIIYDKDGYYSKVAHQFDDYYDFSKEEPKNIIELELNINPELPKVKTIF